ncbi:triacylglycerol lipase [Schizosaccharomyces cryophilus OY26]|uniref:Triacylglycerol lipase n=1 Tax=Schizosaccharomyces cryophilus (strain OY26 / ATCC MYA-4695 / CBS 11777 / NBRC 106824 / NRRL Y48691) TaxID=653667 RepID=S9X4M0_SCHCR|nr:triacylglycerol lipase [Schizosaccharomyces cryophilus OY26]EPY52022.1 triacylglycerol lipase [Schizosaccharomyces cryophilus OY26]
MNSLSRAWQTTRVNACTVWLLVLSFFEWLFSATSISQARGLNYRKGKTVLKRDCCTWEDWKQLATATDKKSGRWKWRFDPVSNKYDFSLIERCTSTLKLYRTKKQSYPMLMFLRSSLLRNFGNIGDSGLYTENYSGTKILIEEYVREVNRCLNFLFLTRKLSLEEKQDFFSAAKVSFGTTCLYLNGGTAFGLYHFGVAKVLWERTLLPRVLAGSASGALIAALLGVHRDDELDHLFQTFPEELWDICKNTSDYSLAKVIKYGNMLDISMIASFVHKCVGELTFQEAFEKTNRAINIIAPPSVTSGSPQVLNYHTAPNVLVWSAACASNSWAAIYRSTSLLAKLPDGTTEVCTPKNFVWPYASMNHPTRPNSYARISELFNVNHFIITQSRPSLFPTFHDELHHHTHTGYTLKIIRLFGLEMAYRFRQMDILGLLPMRLRRFLVDDFIPSAYITLTPTFSFTDIKHAFTKPSLQDIQYWILVGERATWQAIPLLQIRCKSEFLLNCICEQIGFSKSAKIPLEPTLTPSVMALEENEEKLLKNFKVQ